MFFFSSVHRSRLAPGPGKSRTTASCQPEVRKPRIPLRQSVRSERSLLHMKLVRRADIQIEVSIVDHPSNIEKTKIRADRRNPGTPTRRHGQKQQNPKAVMKAAVARRSDTTGLKKLLKQFTTSVDYTDLAVQVHSIGAKSIAQVRR